MAQGATNTHQIPISHSASSITLVYFPTNLTLTPSTYIGWRTQIEAILDVLSLRPYIDGSQTAPPTTITNDSVTSSKPSL